MSKEPIEPIQIRTWIKKHAFDEGDTSNFLVGKTLDGVLVKSLNTKVSEVALDSYINDIRAVQRRKAPNKGASKKGKAESAQAENLGAGNVKLKKINKPKLQEKVSATKPKEVAKTDKQTENVVKNIADTKKEIPKVEETQIENKVEEKSTKTSSSDTVVAKAPKVEEKSSEENPKAVEPVESVKANVEVKKAPAFTANVSKFVDPAILARIQKSQQEKASMRSGGGFKGGQNNRGGGAGGFKNNSNNKSGGGTGNRASATGYSGNLRNQPRQTENKAQSGMQIRRAGFGSTLQDALSVNTPAHKDFLDRAHGSRGGHTHDSHGKDRKKGKDSQKDKELQKETVEKALKKVSDVFVSLSKTPAKKTYNKDKSRNETDEPLKVIQVSAFISAGELAALLELPSARVIGKCMEMGKMININHQLDFETVQIIADEFGFEAKLMDEYKEEALGIQQDSEESLVSRHPVITVMGHVDHGKTSLLDYIRKTNVVRGEFGGITQHIGAYEVETPKGKITFLDTPGHEAFNAMRARGSQVTDVIVLVVAADSMVMPQTVEVIELAKSSNVSLVVAITKVDLPTANTEKIMSQLSERGVQVVEWGGKISCVEVSVKTGKGIDKLLETLALESEVLELKANPNANARGSVIESRLDAGKGTMATILVQNGTLHVRDCFVCGNYSGRVRALFNDRGDSLKEAGPSTPCQVLGFTGTPQAGDDLVVVENDQIASEVASKRQQAARERALRSKITLEGVYEGKVSELNLVVKTDVAGSCEVLAESLSVLSNSEVKVKIVRKGVGAINEDDVHLASISNAIIIAFHLMPSYSIRELAEQEGVEIKTYRVIYEVIEEIKGAIERLLKPISKEEVTGEAEIRQVFKIPKIGLIAGCMVKSGEVDRESQVRVYRAGVELGLTKVQSLKRSKDDVSSVKSGLECGIGLRGYDNIEEGDSLIFFKQITVARTLADLEKEKK